MTFEEALFSGYANDGGLLVPECIPQSMESMHYAYNPCTYVKLKMNLTLFVNFSLRGYSSRVEKPFLPMYSGEDSFVLRNRRGASS